MQDAWYVCMCNFVRRNCRHLEPSYEIKLNPSAMTIHKYVCWGRYIYWYCQSKLQVVLFLLAIYIRFVFYHKLQSFVVLRPREREVKVQKQNGRHLLRVSRKMLRIFMWRWKREMDRTTQLAIDLCALNEKNRHRRRISKRKRVNIGSHFYPSE